VAVGSETEGDLPELHSLLDPPGGATLAGVLGERYEVRHKLGAGAFGEVYRAHDRLLNRDVAIKRIRLDAFADPGQLEDVKKRFLREAQVAARLRHPNIVTTHDIVSTPSSSFIVMELVGGTTLQATIAARGRLTLAETLAVVEPIGSALDHAHAAGVVHRDVKPANVMIEPSGVAKVMDFGIAKEAGGNLTATGLVMGTPSYMSPEQARGETVDARSDLFSLGCVAYECLTGRRPFEASSVASILVRVLTEDPPPPDEGALGLPAGTAAVLSRATAKDPAARFPTAAAMVEALRALEGPRGATQTVGAVAAPAPASRRPAASAPGRGLGGAAIAVAALAALGAAAGVLYWRSRPVRVPVTIPAGTTLHLALDAAVSSETAVEGQTVTGTLSRPLRVEGAEALPVGSRVAGAVRHPSSAGQAGGRGEMTLEFDSVEPPDGGGTTIAARPLTVRAPAPRRKEQNAIVSGLKQVGSAVGGLIGGRDGSAAGSVVGGAAATVIVSSQKGREVTLPDGAALSIELTEPATVMRPKGP
jgi:tRNA A-37 threonylcarbamoyl transferase component Bud32